MIRKGFREDQINWVIDEGNVPVATIPIAFGRQFDTLKSGNRVMFLSFGAGGEYTCFIADIGGVPPAPPCPNP
jgi:3-oxoacyl-[acyl-carrier-protein] synthase III